MLTDSDERTLALSCNQSFIVQAPAGSGKTELLTQRFLKLLTQVENPEQIVALTFTKKAAFEMRSRIIQALNSSTHELAKKALEMSQARAWHLIENPHRLRIYTIDSFCSQLSKNLPVTSGMGGMPDIEEKPLYLYQQAVKSYLASIEEKGEWVKGLCLILQHFHNRYEVIQKLLVAMLERRDQWLHLVVSARSDPEKIQAVIQQSLLSIHQDTYAHLSRLLSEDLKEKWVYLANIAASQLAQENIKHPLNACLNLSCFPENTEENQEIFSGLLSLVFTSTLTLRKTINKNTGFPSHETEMKKIFYAFIAEIEKNQSLVDLLEMLTILPEVKLDSDELKLLEALWEGLPILVAYLQLIFKQYNKVDFIEVNLKALEALGEEDNPTDLALILDYQLMHLLVDEFQDTSSIQYQLFQKIVSSWQYHDGRTIFVVGDPMQSIYRFRGADVGLYLKLQQSGFGETQLQNITLSSNFRSDKSIVEWVNRSFKHIFSSENDIALSKIIYSPSSSIREYQSSGVFSYEAVSIDEEAKWLVEKLRSIKKNDPEASIAVLVRARYHAAGLFHEIKKHNMTYQAVDMLSLKNSQLIHDLLSLTKLLHQQDNRLALYSLFRSPICGLSLNDLHFIAQVNPLNTSALSKEGQSRVAKILAVLSYWQENQYRLPLYQSVRHLWTSLGFELFYQEKINANSYFELLQSWEEGNEFGDFNALEEKIASLYQISDNLFADNTLQIMTIHKAKGLEFDYVFIPSIHHSTLKEDQPLVIFHEIPYANHVDWLVAPKYTATKRSKIYDYIYGLLKQKAEYETQRLLYVAATRAKKQLHWSYVRENAQDAIPKDSFLAMLAPYLHATTLSKTESSEEGMRSSCSQDSNPTYSPFHIRISSNTDLPWQQVDSALIPSIQLEADNPLNRPVIQGYEKQAVIGSYLHRLFANWTPNSLLKLNAHKNNLLAMGLAKSDLDKALELIIKMLEQCKNDPKFIWIMDLTHDTIYNEMPLNFMANNKLQTRILDKFFIDQKSERAWIVDFKLSLETLNPEEHLPQLKEYARLINNLELARGKSLHLGLYYPYQSYWWEQKYLCAV